MGAMFFSFGPFFDFLYLVFIYSIFVDKNDHRFLKIGMRVILLVMDVIVGILKTYFYCGYHCDACFIRRGILSSLIIACSADNAYIIPILLPVKCRVFLFWCRCIMKKLCSIMVLDSLLECRYDRDSLEIIPINDNSSDATAELLENTMLNIPHSPFAQGFQASGKPAGLNDGMEMYRGYHYCFDADYRRVKIC